MSSAVYMPPLVSSRWLRNALFASLLVHALVLLAMHGLQRDVPPPEKLISVELRRDEPPPPPPSPPPPPPVRAVTPPPKVAPPPVPRPIMPPPPVAPTPVITAAPEAAPRPEQPVIQRPPEPAPPPPPAPAPAPVPVPAPAPPPQAVVDPGPDQNELRRGYIRGVSASVAKQRRYPKLAAQRGWQGEVTLRVVVDGSGHLVEVAIQQGSGYEALDKEAMEMVRRAAPFPFAAGMRKEGLTITLPVQFRLESP